MDLLKFIHFTKEIKNARDKLYEETLFADDLDSMYQDGIQKYRAAKKLSSLLSQYEYCYKQHFIKLYGFVVILSIILSFIPLISLGIVAAIIIALSAGLIFSRALTTYYPHFNKVYDLKFLADNFNFSLEDLMKAAKFRISFVAEMKDDIIKKIEFYLDKSLSICGFRYFFIIQDADEPARVLMTSFGEINKKVLKKQKISSINLGSIEPEENKDKRFLGTFLLFVGDNGEKHPYVLQAKFKVSYHGSGYTTGTGDISADLNIESGILFNGKGRKIRNIKFSEYYDNILKKTVEKNIKNFLSAKTIIYKRGCGARR